MAVGTQLFHVFGHRLAHTRTNTQTHTCKASEDNSTAATHTENQAAFLSEDRWLSRIHSPPD